MALRGWPAPTSFQLGLTRVYFVSQPFFHSTTGAKHIMWGARDRLGLNFGVLTA